MYLIFVSQDTQTKGGLVPESPFRPMRFSRRAMSLLLLLIFNWGLALPACADVNAHPLSPPDTDNPRSTLMYFMNQMNRAYQVQLVDGFKSKEARDYLQTATLCLDLSDVIQANRQDVGFESALLLMEILGRIDIPPEGDIPDAASMAAENLNTWNIPHTEITISKVIEGPYEGQFLFSPQTVARIREFYDRIKALPYIKGAAVGIYEDYIYSPGPLIPNQIISSLPKFARSGYFEQAVWQWFAALLLLGIGVYVVLMVLRWSRSGQSGDVSVSKGVSLRWFIGPLVLFVVCITLRYLIDEQINFTGAVLNIFVLGMRLSIFFAVGWFILLSGHGVSTLIVSSPRFRPKEIDPTLTHLICRLITWVILIVLLWNVSAYIGISFTAVFASAGIAGIALALAARELLANFFGGVSLLLDRPFKTGDFILLDSGERGMVVSVGMRSTRILTRDDIQIAIPNSIITSTKIINESAPRQRFRVRIKIGVAFDSDIDLVEKTLLEIAQRNKLTSPTPDPRVRFRSFGESALEFELLCWAHRPLDKGRLIHELNCEIYKTFKEEGIQIPFPQQDIHLTENSHDQ